MQLLIWADYVLMLISIWGQRDRNACCCSWPPCTCRVDIEYRAFDWQSSCRGSRIGGVSQCRDIQPSTSPPHNFSVRLTHSMSTSMVEHVEPLGKDATGESISEGVTTGWSDEANWLRAAEGNAFSEDLNRVIAGLYHLLNNHKTSTRYIIHYYHYHHYLSLKN